MPLFRNHCNGSAAWRGGALLATILGIAQSLSAFQGVPPGAGSQGRGENEGLSPPDDRDAESWLRRARQAAEEKDWKLAADTLTRVVEEYWDKTVAMEDGRWASALRAAQNQIGGWPAEGLAAYRLLYDPEVRQRLTRAREHLDLDELRSIVRRYPHSSEGPEAMNLLAGWLIDRREAGEAVSVLHKLSALNQTSIPAWQIEQKLTVAYALDGRTAAAEESLRKLRKLVASTGPATSSLARVEDLQRFIGSPQPDSHQQSGRQTTKYWPILLGPAGAEGRMAGIDPAVTPGTMLREMLPGGRAIDAEWILRLIKQTGRPPVWQLASDGRMLFATCPDGLVARDLTTFDLLWQVTPRLPPRDPRIDRQRMMTGTIDVDNSDRLDEPTTRALWHEYRGALSTALGLVFMIEQTGTANEQFPSRHGSSSTNAIFSADYYAQPNSLRAFEASTGRALWTKGRGGPPEDGLRVAHFYSPPVASGSQLIAPCQDGPDLFLLVMGREGQVTRRVLLGTAQPGMLPMNGVLQPTIEDGVIYLCTGAGLLIALDAADYSLIWLAPYQRSDLIVAASDIRRQWMGAAASPTLRQPDLWVQTPPLIVNGLVIVAPPDGEFVLAFDRSTGAKKWAYPRGAHRYLVGAARQRLILAGRSVAAIDPSNGQARWVFDRAAPTGRPALCGDQVCIPTVDGLYRVDAHDGAPIGERLASEWPLGNLFALDGALYSMTADSLSKFPDFSQSERIAEELLAKRPGDSSALLRLAWLCALKGRWSEALAKLDDAEKGLTMTTTTAPDTPLASRADLLDRIAHQRIDYLLRLAEASGVEDRRTYLERALAASRRSSDVLRSGLALCEWLKETGSLEEASRRLFALLRTAPNGALSLEADLTVSPVVAIRERMESIWQTLNPAQRKSMGGELAAEIAKARKADTPEALERIADGLSGLPAAGDEVAALDLQIGKRQLANNWHESGCFFLERCLSNAPQSPAAFEARVRLAMEYASPGLALPAMPGEAARMLSQLSGEDDEKVLPADLPSLRFMPSPTRLGTLREQLTYHLPPDCLRPTAIPEVLRGSPRLELVGEQAVPPQTVPTDVRSFFDPFRPFDLFSDVVPMRLLRQIKGCQTHARSRAPAWWATEVAWSAEQEPPLGAMSVVPHRAAAWAGEVAVLEAESQICAVGLVSGQMLWPPLVLDRTHGPLPDPPVINIRGTIVVAPDCVTLIGAPAREIEQPNWKRQFFGRPLGMLREVDGRLAVVDRSQSRLWLIDPASGRIRRQIQLTERSASGAGGSEPPPETVTEEDESPSPAPLTALAGRVVCRADSERVIARDIITGRRLWERSFPDRVSAARGLDEARLYICHGEKTLEILRATDGTPLRTIRRPGLVFPPSDATIDNTSQPGGLSRGRFLMLARTRTDPVRMVLESIPLEEGEASWRRDLGEFVTISPRMLRASPAFLPMVTYSRRTNEDQRFGQAASPFKQAELLIIDKATNERIISDAFAFVGPLADGPYRSKLICDVIVQDKRVLAVAPEGYYVLKRADKPTPDAGAVENR